jgi:hypothetical protein
MMMTIEIQWTSRLWRRFGTTYLAGTAILGASQYSDGVLTVLLLQMVVLRLDSAATKQSNTGRSKSFCASADYNTKTRKIF